MKIVIGIVFLLDLILLVLSLMQENPATNQDDWAYAYGYLGGIALVAIAASMTVGYGLFRLFFG